MSPTCPISVLFDLRHDIYDAVRNLLEVSKERADGRQPSKEELALLTQRKRTIWTVSTEDEVNKKLVEAEEKLTEALMPYLV